MKTTILILVSIAAATMCLYPDGLNVQGLVISAWVWCFVAWLESRRAEFWETRHKELEIAVNHYLEKNSTP